MLEENGKFRKPIWVNFAGLALLLVTSGFTLSACQMPISGGKSTDEKLKEAQPAKVEQQKSDEQLKGNQPAKSGQQKNNKPADGEDTQVDDDPE